MSTSELGYYQRFDEAEIGEDAFADTELCRVALNNLNHLADQRSQVLVSWNDTGETTADEDYVTAYEANPVDETFYEIWRSTSFDLSVQNDGTSYRCRGRALVSSNHASVACNFRLALSWVGANAEAERARASANVGSVAVTSTSYSWQQPSSLLYLDAEQVRQARIAAGTAAAIDSVGGAERGAVWVRAHLVIFGACDTVASGSARLGGAYLAEFLQP